MKKLLLTLSSGAMALTLMAGCGAGDNRDLNGNGVRNVGYYTNQGNPNVVPNNDMTRNNRSYMRNADVNNNGNNNFQYDNATARRIASQVTKIHGVKDASVLINGNTVIVGVVPTSTNTQNTQALDEHVRTVTKSLVNDKQVRVVTDRNIVNRMIDVNNRMDNGTPGREIKSDVQGIFNDITDAVKRPFQNNAH